MSARPRRPASGHGRDRRRGRCRGDGILLMAIKGLAYATVSFGGVAGAYDASNNSGVFLDEFFNIFLFHLRMVILAGREHLGRHLRRVLSKNLDKEAPPTSAPAEIGLTAVNDVSFSVARGRTSGSSGRTAPARPPSSTSSPASTSDRAAGDRSAARISPACKRHRDRRARRRAHLPEHPPLRQAHGLRQRPRRLQPPPRHQPRSSRCPHGRVPSRRGRDPTRRARSCSRFSICAVSATPPPRASPTASSAGSRSSAASRRSPSCSCSTSPPPA